ncbi:hypothetical protein GCM10022221_60210 [Actinocorallia aurea]
MPFVVGAAQGVSVRDRLKHLTAEDERVLRLVGEHLGRLASLDLKARCADGLGHAAGRWAVRNQALTAVSSSRWAGSITKASQDQWALSRRCQSAYIQGLEAGVATLSHRLSQPVGAKGSGRVQGGYRSKGGDRIEANRAVAYRIHLGVARGRWYVTASWTRPAVTVVPLETARAAGMVGVDTDADHFAAAQTREKHGRKRRFRQIISRMPTGRVKARLVPTAAEHGLAIVAVDPAYNSMWGDAHWRKPLTSKTRRMSRHDAASVAIGRRALGYPIRRRTAPPRTERSDRYGHRTVRAGPGVRGHEEPRPPATERAHDGCCRAGSANAEDQRIQHRSGCARYRETAPDATPGHG